MKKMYDFETMINRTKTGSQKWDDMKEINHNIPNDIYPFSLADSDLQLAPEIIEGLKEKINNHLSLGYTHADEEYNHALQQWFLTHHHYTIQSEWIVQTPGVVSAVNFAIRALTNENDGVLLMTPIYYPFYETLEKTKRRLVECPLINKGCRYEIDFDDLEDKMREKNNTMLILCSPHNPIGRVWTKEELTRIAHLCLQYGIYLISDEIHADLIMNGHTHHMMGSISKEIEQHVIMCTAASKTFNIAGQCVSNIIIPNDEWRQKFIEEKESYGIKGVNALGLMTTQIAYERGGQWLEAFLNLVETNHQLIKSFFAKYFPKVHVFDLEGTYLQWVDFRPLGFTPEELEHFLNDEAYDFFDQGYIFGHDAAGFERINLSASTESISAMLQRFKEAFEHHQ